uniref:Pyridoxamine 5'-phosphate oxidase n=1 Tax=Marseillevirus LCMAC202 TaxID=2506606 RepID=A0A481Z0I1_9VIRU|nr:MAG: pyridoxamine 5'-phosphate oxidase [Marseillevirus LCMAC202]
MFLYTVVGFNITLVAEYAKWMVNNKTSAVLATHSVENVEYPFATIEDYVVNTKGIPYFLLSTMSHSARDLDKNSHTAISIFANNCSKVNYEHDSYDALACWRLTLSGPMRIYKHHVYANSTDVMVNDFFKRHPAAKSWIKYSPHQFMMWTLDKIDDIFYAGGYGNIHYVGPLNITAYTIASCKKPTWV